MIAGSLLAIPLLVVAPVGAAPTEPLDASVFDVSAFPAVLIDVTVPRRHAAVGIASEMVEVDGAPVESVAPVDPTGIVVSLVIDDGPAVDPVVVEDAQGASVELVRNVGEGMQIALATPSGLQSALTADRRANIARIAGITAGAPDVVPLPELVLAEATRLAESPEEDRHLVIVQSTPIPAGPVLDEIAAVVTAAGIKLHVVAAPGLDTGPVAELAAATGGVVPVAPAMVAEMDDVTAAISARYRLATTVAGSGPHEVAVTIDGERFATEVVVEPPPAPSPTVTTPATTAPSPAAVPAPTAPATTAAPTTSAAAPTTTAAPAEGFGRGTRMLVAAVLAVVAIGLCALWFLLRRRRAARTATEAWPAPSAVGLVASHPPTTVTPAPAEVPEPAAASPWAMVVDPGAAEPRTVVHEPPPPEPEPAPVAKREPVAERKPIPKRERRTRPEPEPEPVAVSEPEPEPEPEPQPEPEPAPVKRRPDGRTPIRAGASLRRSAPRKRESPAQPIRRTPRRPSTPEPEPAEPGWLVVGDLRMCSATGEVLVGGHPVVLTPAELAVLELLMKKRGQGVTTEAIIEAAKLDESSEEWDDPDAIVTQLRRKTGIRGRGQSVRKERVLLYFFGDDEEGGAGG